MTQGSAMTLKEFKTRLNNIPEVRYIKGFEHARSQCEFKCVVCKHIWTTRAGRVLAGTSCPKCSDLSRGVNRRKTHKDFVVELKAVAPNIECVGKYTTARVRLEFKHNCGTHWMALPRNVLQGSGCPTCANSLRSVSLGRRQVGVRGYEPQGLKWLLAAGVKDNDIAVYNEGTVPSFRYKLYGSSRLFCPDFLVKSKRQIVEVKSLATLGLTEGFYDYKPGVLFAMTKAKAKITEANGYKFLLLVMNQKGERIKLPKNWCDLTRTKLRSILGL